MHRKGEKNNVDQAIEIGKLLHDSPDLFPWVVLSIILIILAAQHKRIFAYFDARIESYSARQKADAVMAELIRNNTAALNNNTAALESVKIDRGESRRMITYHEQASKERIDALRSDIEHIQTVVNRIDETVSSNSESIRIVEDRTRK